MGASGAAPGPIDCDAIFTAWQGLLTTRPWRASRLSLKAPIRASTSGGSGAFLGTGTDDRDYWIKTLNSGQGDRVAVTEEIVGRAAALVCTTCCEAALLYIPSAASGWEFRPGLRLERGFAHGSLALENCTEVGGPPTERNRDDNGVRHVGYFVIYDWCWGGDAQGLVSLDQDRAFFSHDHGWFLPPEGPTWSDPELRLRAGEPHELGADRTGLNPTEVVRIADRLEALTRDEILTVVESIPRSWPVTNKELEHVGAFLECRAPLVASRLRAYPGINP